MVVPMTHNNTRWICADCTDWIADDDQHTAFTDPYTGDRYHADCDDRAHDLSRCDCPMCDEDRADR